MRIYIIAFMVVSCVVSCLLASKAVAAGLEPSSSSTELSVINLTPAGEVNKLTQITASFSRSVVPLGKHGAITAAESPLKLYSSGAPLPAGKFKWLNPTTIAYVFDKPLEQPVEVKAEVPAGVTALSGAKLMHSISQDIYTPRLIFKPQSGSKVQESVSFTANYQIDPKKLLAKTKLKTRGKNLSLSLPTKNATVREGYSSWRYTFNIKTSFPPDSTLELTVAAGISAKEGGIPLEKNFTATLNGYPSFHAELDGVNKDEKSGESRLDPEQNIVLNFTRPVRFAELMQAVTLTPAAEISPEGKEQIAENMESSYVVLPFILKADTNYTVSLKAGLQSADKKEKLKQTAHYSLRTQSYAPLFHMESGFKTLEAGTPAAFPLYLRNIPGSVAVNIRYLPFASSGFSAILPELDAPMVQSKAPENQKGQKWYEGAMSSASFAKLYGAKEYNLDLDFSAKKNLNIMHQLNLNSILGLPEKAPLNGLVRIKVLLPEALESNTTRWYGPKLYTAFVQSTNIGLSVKRAPQGSLIFSSSLSAAKALSGTELSLLDSNGKSLWQGKSSSSGIASVPALAPDSKAAYLLAALQGQDSTLLPLSSYGNMHSNYGISQQNEPILSIHSISQLPLYQPGQTVNYTVYAATLNPAQVNTTNDNAKGWQPLASTKVTLKLQDNRGKTLQEQELTTNAYGAVNSSVALSKEAPLGWYSFNLTLGSKQSSTKAVKTASSTAFQVASFRQPEFKVDVLAPASQPVPVSKNKSSDSGLKVAVDAVYFSGTPVRGDQDSSAQLKVKSEKSFVNLSQLYGYKTGMDVYPWVPLGRKSLFLPNTQEKPEEHTLKLNLDNAGHASVELPSLKVPGGSPRAVTLEADIADASALTTQGSASFTLHPSEYYIGVKAPRFMLVGKTEQVSLKAATWDDTPLSNVKVSMLAERIDADGKASKVWKHDITLSGKLKTDADISFDKAGQYHLTLEIADKAGRVNRTRCLVYASNARGALPFARQDASLELVSDAQTYSAPSSAAISYFNPFEEATAIITVERESIQQCRIESITRGNQNVLIQMDKKNTPYTYVSVTLLKGRSEALPEQLTSEFSWSPERSTAVQENQTDGAAPLQPDLGAPAIMHGTILLNVKDDRQPVLQAELSTDKKVYLPAEKVKVTLQVKDNHGKGRKAGVTLLAVDDSVLRASGENLSYDPSGTFSTRTSYFTRLSDTRPTLLKRLFPLTGTGTLGAMSRNAAAPMMADAMFKSTNSIDAAGGSGIELRSNFTPLAYWLASAETDENGTLQTEFTLPDNLTSYRIVAIAVSADADFARLTFATAQSSIQARKPLQIRSALPRFLTAGDNFEARVLLQNTTDLRSDVEIVVAAEGFHLLERRKTVTLDAGSSATVGFAARVATSALPQTATFKVSGSMAGKHDSASFQIPLKTAFPLDTVAAAGRLNTDGATTIKLQLPDRLDPRSNLSVIFAPSPASGLKVAKSTLENYQWDCLEQRLSKAWSKAIQLKYDSDLGLELSAEQKAELSASLRETMQSISKFETADGGLSIWPGMQSSNAFVSAYALLMHSEFTQSAKAGLTEKQVQRLQGYLWNWLQNNVLKDDAKQANYSVNSASFVLYALSSQERLERSLPPSKKSTVVKPENLQQVFIQLMAYASGSEWSKIQANSNFKAKAEWKIKSNSDKVAVNPLFWGAMLLNAQEISGMQAFSKEIISSLEKDAVITPVQLYFRGGLEGRYWASLGSSLRDNGFVLGALSIAKPGYPSLEGLAHWVAQGLGEKNSISTQEAIFSLWGLAEYLQNTSGSKEAILQADWGKASVQKSFKRLTAPAEEWNIAASELTTNTQEELKLKAVKGSPYWTARLSFAETGLVNTQGGTSGSLELPQTAASNGMTIQRSLQHKGQLHIGDVATAELLISVPENRRHVLVFAPFPAGMEPVHATRADLQSSGQGGGDLNAGYEWQRKEFREDGVLLYCPELSAGTHSIKYQLRASVPGNFVLRPAVAEEMYTPEVSGRSNAELINIK